MLLKDYKDGEWDFHDENTQEHLHALHPYPAKFIPQIPRKAISLWTSEGDVVLDPFCGCGTTLLESILLGRTAIGVDNNAVACLISKAKTATYSSQDIKTLRRFSETLEEVLDDPKLQISLPQYKNFEYWFSEEVRVDFGKLKAVIQKLSEKPQLFAKAVFSAIIVRYSNQDSDTRYARIEKDYKPRSAINWYILKLNKAINRLAEIMNVPKAKAEVLCQDSRNLDNLSDNSVNLIVTSPPYINAYEYHKYHRHRLHWIDGDVSFARDNEIGRHGTFSRPNATPEKYFDDMFRCFEQWNRVLAPEGRILIVVGDGIVAGKPVAVGDEFVELLRETGLVLEDRWVRRLKVRTKSFNQRARTKEEHMLLFRES